MYLLTMNGVPRAPVPDDLDDLPTGAALRLLGSTVNAQASQLDRVAADLSEIKSLIRSGIWLLKLLAAGVPVVAAVAGAASWIAIHVAVR